MLGYPLESCYQRSRVISTSGFGGRNFEFGSRPTSDNVDSVISMSGLVENVGVAAEIASLFQAVKSYCRFLFNGRRLGFPVDGDVRFCRRWHQIVRRPTEIFLVDTGFVSLAGGWAKLKVCDANCTTSRC